MPHRDPEQIEIHGRTFSLRIDGPDADARFSATITESATGRMLTRTPVRGRSVADARERAAEVIRNLTAIERLQAEAVAAITVLAPGAVIELTEDAHAIRADVSGGWILHAPLTLPRDEITDPDADLEAWATYVRDHLAAYLKPVTRDS
jgi:hypothetical protein